MAAARKHAAGGMVTKRLATLRSSAMARKLALCETILENMSQGYCAFDAELRLVGYNARYVELLGFERGFVRPGITMAEVLHDLAWRGDFGDGDVDQIVAERMAFHGGPDKFLEFERVRPNGIVLAICCRPMPGGGFITTLSPPSPTSPSSAARKAPWSANRRCSKPRSITCRTASLFTTPTKSW